MNGEVSTNGVHVLNTGDTKTVVYSLSMTFSKVMFFFVSWGLGNYRSRTVQRGLVCWSWTLKL